MDELEKKAQKGLESFSKKGEIGIVKSKLDDLVDDMLGEEEEATKSPSKSRKTNWVFLFVAILGLALIGYLGFKDGSNKTEKVEAPVLYAQYFEVLPDAISANERSDNQESEIRSDADMAMELYNKGDYKRAAPILKNQDVVDYLVFGAIAEMKNNNHDSAIALLLKSQLIDLDNKYKDIIEWYLALSYLNNGNSKDAKGLFYAIANQRHYKQKEAKAILKAMK